jgi:hypothetical protein
VSSDPAAIRWFAGRALVGGLCLAAAVAVVALLTGSFDETETRVILTSIGFAATSGTGSAGAAARLRPSESLQLIGSVTVVASAATFLLLVLGLWTDDWGSEGIWRAFGCAGVLAIAGSHASLTLGARRQRDSEAVRLLTFAAIAFSAFDTVASILPIAGVMDDVDEGWGRVFGATLVLLILTSVLPPILRRMQPAPARAADAPGADGHQDAAPEFFATAVIQIVEKIELLNADPGNRSPEIRAELGRLKSLAKSYEI